MLEVEGGVREVGLRQAGVDGGGSSGGSRGSEERRKGFVVNHWFVIVLFCLKTFLQN